MMTDLILKKEETEVSPEVLRGIQLHRTIDQLTDAHPIFVRHKRSLYPYFRKYSPVVLDIIYDYLLENNWDLFAEVSYQDFQQEIYVIIEDHIDEFPIRVQPMVSGMVRGRWLDQYSDLEGLQNVFTRLEKKIRFPQSFERVSEVVSENEDQWEKDHFQFFKDVRSDLVEEGWPILRSGVRY